MSARLCAGARRSMTPAGSIRAIFVARLVAYASPVYYHIKRSVNKRPLVMAAYGGNGMAGSGMKHQWKTNTGVMRNGVFCAVNPDQPLNKE